MIDRHLESVLFAVAAAAFFALSTAALAAPPTPLASEAQQERYTRHAGASAYRSSAVFVTQAIELAACVRAPARPSISSPDREKA
jgi:hypothetical protein